MNDRLPSVHAVIAKRCNPVDMWVEVQLRRVLHARKWRHCAAWTPFQQAFFPTRGCNHEGRIPKNRYCTQNRHHLPRLQISETQM
jgi:hypothetical protein